MISSNESSLNRLFRLKGEIYQEASLSECLRKLELKETDLLIMGSFIYSLLTKQNQTGNADLLNINQFGTGEPMETWVDEILKVSNAKAYQRIIAIGGGAVIDIAKLCIFGDGRDASALFADKLELRKQRELIALPTTCGTGSEVTSVSVVEFPTLGSKLGLQLDALFPDKAILIGELLTTLPFKTFVITSIDALAHAVESLLSPKANPYTDMFARSAIEGIVIHLQEEKCTKQVPKQIAECLISADMAGIAFSIAGCATMHALSFPLGAVCHLTHGEAVYAVFAQTLMFYRNQAISLAKLERILSPLFSGSDSIQELIALLSSLMPCPDFNSLGITEAICETWALSVYENQQRLLVNAPKPLTCEQLAVIYKSCINEEEKI